MTLDMNTIYQGDCLELMKDIPDKSIDLVLTDPPYKISSLPPGNSELMSLGKYNSQNFVQITDGFAIENTLNEFKRILKKINIFIFCSNLQIPDIMQWGFNNKYYTTLLVWNKSNSAPFANGVWRQDAEFIIHIREKGAYFQGGAEIKRKITVLPTNPSQYGHPSEKPLKLIEKYLLIGSTENHIIFDPFLGSGTTAIACINTGRNFIGIEKDEEYFKIAQNRIREAQGQSKLEVYI